MGKLYHHTVKRHTGLQSLPCLQPTLVRYNFNASHRNQAPEQEQETSSYYSTQYQHWPCQFVFIPSSVGAGIVVWAQPDTHQLYSVKRIGTRKKLESFLSMPSFRVHSVYQTAVERNSIHVFQLLLRKGNGACYSDTKMTLLSPLLCTLTQ